MSQREPESGSDGDDPADHPWSGVVRFSDPHVPRPIAYRDNQVITSGRAAALQFAQTIDPGVTQSDSLGPFDLLVGMRDPGALVRALQDEGYMAQLNHTHFHHALMASPVFGSPVFGSPVFGSPVFGSPVFGSPVFGSPVFGSPVFGSPVFGSPVFGSPVFGSPVFGSPVFGSPVRGAHRHGHGPRWSSARPAPAERITREMQERPPEAAADADGPQVFVLDTGLAATAFRPRALPDTVTAASPSDVDTPDDNGDGYLDPAAGHGTFIAGIIGQLAPGCRITVHRVLSNYGEGHEWDIAKTIEALLPKCNERTIVSLSFGGYVQEGAHTMEWAIRRLIAKNVVVVASAGNDATCRPAYPAALPGVICVGALGPAGPALFTNYGPWVDFCAPGVDLLSTFFRGFDGKAVPGIDGAHHKEDYDGWAVWSGTSFAAPVVAGHLAQAMMLGAPSANAAVRRLRDAPTGLSIPNLGRIVQGLS